MNVAFIDPIAHHGGQHYYTDQLARGLQASGVSILVYGLAGDSFCTRQTLYPYMPVFREIYGDDPAMFRGLRFGLGLVRIACDLFRRDIEIVHINIWQYNLRELLQVFLAKIARRKIVLTIHDVETFGAATSESRRKYIMKSASGLVIHNEFSRSRIPKIHLARKVISIIPRVGHVAFVDGAATREAARQRLGLPVDKIIFLYFGNPRHEKGLDVALQAMTYLKDLPDVMMLSGGRMRESQEKEFRSFLRENHLEDRVRMDVGIVPDDVAFDYYLSSDLVLAPYRKVYESGVAIMAASCGRPIVASDLPVFVDFIEGGRAGFVFRNEDAEDMARVLRKAVSNPAELERMGCFAKENIAQQRGAEQVGRRTAELYQLVLGSRGVP